MLGWLFQPIADRLIRARGGAATAYTEALNRSIAGIRTLSPSEARSRARALLDDGETFEEVERARCDAAQLPATLGPSLREFFSEYAGLTVSGGAVRRDDVATGPFEGWLWLGQVDEHAHLVARPHDDQVYELCDDSAQDEEAEAYPTIYHWILKEAKAEELARRMS